MKKILYLLLVSLFVFTSCNQEDEIIDVALKAKPIKTTICHYNPHNDTWKTIDINEKQLAKHIDHGDRVGGGCEDYTYIPDDAFEQTLISYYGYDDVLDDYVLTSNINSVTHLWYLSGRNINDLTGIEGFTNLELLHCGQNNLTSLDVSKNLKLKSLSCHMNQLKSLDVTKNTALEYLWVLDNQITNIDVSKNVNLDDFNCRTNQITNLDVSQNTKLRLLTCNDNNLTSLDVSKNIALSQLNSSNNELTELNVSGASSLIAIYTNDNQLTSLDISQNSNLYVLWVENNQLTELNANNVSYNNPFQLKTTNNPNLTCIQVFDASKANAGLFPYQYWFKDPWTSFSEDCGY